MEDVAKQLEKKNGVGTFRGKTILYVVAKLRNGINLAHSVKEENKVV